MAVNDNTRDDAQRDPQLARLLAAASRDEPPAALDAAILAAARREVNARPQVVGQTAGGGGESGTPPLRAKRNWYVPVSIAAMMVLSVSLVLTMHQEKGDELSQPPTSAPAPSVAKPQAPAAADAMAEKADTALKDAVSAKPKLAEEKRTEAAAVAGASRSAAAVDGHTERAHKPRAEKPATAPDSAAALGGLAGARKDQAGNVAREQAPDASMARNLPGAVPAPTTAAPAPARVPEAFPAPREREAAPPTTASRDAVESRARMEADRDMRRAAPEAPAVSATPAPAAAPPPPPAPVAAPRRAVPTDDNLARQAPQAAGAAGRSGSATPGARGMDRETITGAASTPAESARVEDRAAPPASISGGIAAPQAKSAPPPPAKKAAAFMQQRLPVWRGLEDQPPEKWLERLAEFKRDNRQADADELLAEFRRRFPDHPASAR